LWQIFAESANDYDQCSDEHAFLLLLHFTLREWDTAVMIIVVFDANDHELSFHAMRLFPFFHA
jgi:hypothetical protein